tara:strand:- start:1826 stop:2245 length:420 start_codon:yes stop_codon:yes gene_type:complete
MNALEKYAAKNILLRGLKKAKVFGKKVRGDYSYETGRKFTKSVHDTVYRGGSLDDLEKARSSYHRARVSENKAKKQLGKGLAGLAGLAALGVGAKVVGRRGTQSSIKRLSQFAKKNKRGLAIGGGAAGIGTLALLKNRK